ncbi:MAG: hypothetical protein O7A03_01845 [Alphaproteobacteria bacterium]|nr:hypothetical protein [Alphaproteobacteria bacterium]
MIRILRPISLLVCSAILAGSLLGPLPEPVAIKSAAAQVIIGGAVGRRGVTFGGILFFGPPIPHRPPPVAFQADLAGAGPPTSSGLIFYTTPGVIWSCQATDCGGQGLLARLTLETCIELAHQTGPVTALSAAGRHFSPEAIQACNRAAGDTSPGVIAPPSTARGGVIAFPGQ